MIRFWLRTSTCLGTEITSIRFHFYPHTHPVSLLFLTHPTELPCHLHLFPQKSVFILISSTKLYSSQLTEYWLDSPDIINQQNAPKFLPWDHFATLQQYIGKTSQRRWPYSLSGVSWSLTSLFSTNMAIQRQKVRDGKLSVPSEGRLTIY